MFLDLLAIGIGLITIYLLLSLICTAANELVAGLLDARARTLKKGITKLLADTGFLELEGKFFDHALIRSVAEGDKSPSYIPPETFSKTMLDLIATEEAGPLTWARVEAGAADILARARGRPNEVALRQTLRVLVDNAAGDLEELRSEIENWFDGAMTRVSAWYRKRTQRALLLIASLVALATNADTLGLVGSLSENEALRDVLVAQAELYVEQGQPAEGLQPTIDRLQTLGVPMGWDAETLPSGFGAWLLKVVGLLLTAFALSLGAPFWFDLLRKAVNIRSVGLSPHETKGAKAKT